MAHRELARDIDPRWADETIAKRQRAADQTAERRRVEREGAVDTGNECRRWLIPQRRPRERRPLRLRYGREVERPVLARELRCEPEDRRGDRREQRVLLVAHAHASRERKERCRL